VVWFLVVHPRSAGRRPRQTRGGSPGESLGILLQLGVDRQRAGTLRCGCWRLRHPPTTRVDRCLAASQCARSLSARVRPPEMAGSCFFPHRFTRDGSTWRSSPATEVSRPPALPCLAGAARSG
jgi:hypothetical protein